MKKLLPLLFLLTFIVGTSFAQESEGGMPYSFNKSVTSNIDVLYIAPLDFNKVDEEDMLREQQGKLPFIGRTVPVTSTLDDNGTWINFKDGSKLWQLKITAQGAEGVIVNYSKLKLTYGSELYLYSADKKFVIGAFTYQNNRSHFTTEMTPGEDVILEYYQPANAHGNSVIDIESIAYIYRESGFRTADKGFADSESCEININCSPEGDNAQDQKRGVVRILLTAAGGQGWCSGSLINTTENNCTPYILTADHCGHDASASELPQWIFYFNYEAVDCASPTSEGSLASQSMTGCDVVADGGSSGTEGSDFYLVETTDPVPDSYDPYWNGWDRSDDGASSGYSIHHPAGDIKKISHFDTPLISTDYNGSGYTTAHWEVTWATTASGWGVTEGGSSGSPIFNDAGRIIGDLTGGAASCSNQSAPDFYGKIWFSWDQNATSTSASGNPTLAPYLDPVGAAPMTVDGRNACTTITSDFSADITVAYKNENITFTESVTIATDPISTWAWDFGGAAASPATDNTAGPVVVTYNTTGFYTVSLDVSDGTLSDDEVKTNYIEIVDSLTADYTTASFNVSTGASIDFSDASYGGKGTVNTWTWTFPSATPATDNVQNPTGIVWSTPGDYSVQLCVETDLGETDCVIYLVHVADPTDLQFEIVGTPTTVVVGAGVDFLSNVLANGPITTWNWSFSGADVPTSTAEFPAGITWSTAGDYDVSLTAYSAADTQTVTNVAYIHVIDSSDAPMADFVASATVISPGAIIDYTNLTTNYALVDSSQWILSGATAPNDNIVILEPTSVEYLNPGYYDATLIIYNSVLGNDTITKTDYIYVVDPSNLNPCYARFRATTSRLIQQGWAVSFETIDNEIGDAQYFEWTFEGGTPATFTGQVPPEIFYNSTEGAYDVSLKVWNDSGANDSLNKVEYIIVITQWPWGDPDGFCDDDLTNMAGEIPHSARHFISNPGDWGYFPGHNHLKIRYYAEKYTNYTFDKIRAININNSRIYNASTSYNKVVFYIWNVDEVTGKPDSILGTKTQYISDFSQGITFPVTFDDPVPVNEEFYAGFKLYYPGTSGEPQDTFAVYYSGNRPYGPNTVMCAKSTSDWKTPTDMLGDTLEISMSLGLKACIIKVDEIDAYADEISLYPNPTSGKVTIDLGDLPYINPDLRVYDITGRLVDFNANHVYGNVYELNLANNATGIYMVTFDFGGVIVTKKLTLIK